jgi:hypothetical protein
VTGSVQQHGAGADTMSSPDSMASMYTEDQ